MQPLPIPVRRRRHHLPRLVISLPPGWCDGGDAFIAYLRTHRAACAAAMLSGPGRQGASTRSPRVARACFTCCTLPQRRVRKGRVGRPLARPPRVFCGRICLFFYVTSSRFMPPGQQSKRRNHRRKIGNRSGAIALGRDFVTRNTYVRRIYARNCIPI